MTCRVFLAFAVAFGLSGTLAGAQGKLDPQADRDTLTAPVPAQQTRLGYGRLITNDLIGDGRDRWRTGSAVSSRVFGPGWRGRPPGSFGQLIEFRLAGQVIAPASLATPARTDRPHAGMLSAGMHTHARRAGVDRSIGVDIVFIGPSTGLIDLQDAIHDIVDEPRPSRLTRSRQVADTVIPTFSASVARSMRRNGGVQVRPFLETRLGDEVLGRAGADLTIGPVARGGLMMRDPVTGHRYTVIRGAPGAGVVLGADVAAVARSVYLPDGLTTVRGRLRAGLRWQGDRSDLFYGLTYLSPEFDDQPQGQVLGSIRWNWRF